MHYQALPAFLLLAPAVLASPVATDAANSDYSNDLDYLNNALENVPTSILSVLATAVPASWYMGLMDPASQSAFLSEASAGIYPDWYSALPSSVVAWASSVAENEDSLFGGVLATATDSASDSATATATGAASASATDSGSGSESATVTATAKTSATRDSTITGTVSPTDTKATTASSEAKTSDAMSDATSDASSSATSATPSSETSTAGAPMATGNVAMSLAGAAGLLGLVAVL
ncbi:hypothetical protein PENSTE_c022G06952 [Penicillium steckii]|uniref:Uncharacterized protein n=1 Tax=Penicillium steckii TaxID=303698 RepID=A0A1V6SSL2_9EURO|nr:hypothetical protein PENSTE_c022G06952 [Penicillium steckii]